MGTTERGLLDHILEEPEDDFPRLVYADWLQDNGQPERGAFIHAHIAWERSGPKTALNTRKKRQSRTRMWQNLQDLYMTCPPPPGFTHVHDYGHPYRLSALHSASCGWNFFLEMGRGFVQRVSCRLLDWMKFGKVLTWHPIEKIEATDVNPEPGPDGLFWWYTIQIGASLGGSGNRLPGEVFDRLPRNDSRESLGFFRGYKTREAAERALSDACLAWARDPVGNSPN